MLLSLSTMSTFMISGSGDFGRGGAAGGAWLGYVLWEAEPPGLVWMEPTSSIKALKESEYPPTSTVASAPVAPTLRVL